MAEEAGVVVAEEALSRDIPHMVRVIPVCYAELLHVSFTSSTKLYLMELMHEFQRATSAGSSTLPTNLAYLNRSFGFLVLVVPYPKGGKLVQSIHAY